MSIFPTTLTEPAVTITPWSMESLGSGLTLIGSSALGSVGSGTWPVANTAYFVPFAITKPIIVAQMFTCNGAAVSGNIDAGIYDSSGTLIISKGSTAQSGTSVTQALDITDTQLGPGVYYMALSVDNTTATFKRGNPGSAKLLAAMGMAEQTTAFALPATATFATVASAYIPIFGLTTRTVI